ncbi:8601_t:CDS:2, partial [Racocetra persica]
MYLFQTNDSESITEQMQFADWLLQLGEGRIPSVSKNNLIQLFDDILLSFQTLQHLIDFVYSDLPTSLYNLQYLVESTKYLSADSIDKTSNRYNPTYKNLYPNKFLNSLKLSGISLHKLLLKVGTPIIILCNIDPTNSLYNRTCLVCQGFTTRVIDTE